MGQFLLACSKISSGKRKFLGHLNFFSLLSSENFGSYGCYEMVWCSSGARFAKHLLLLVFWHFFSFSFLVSGCEPVIVNLDGYVKTKKSLQWLYADAATCGTPAWIGKGLTCVCFKRKGAYERICINLTPLQASS